MKYRKRPVVIDATQWFKNGDHPLDYSKDHQGLEGGKLITFTGEERRARQWEGDIVRYFRRPDVPGDKPCEHCGKVMNDHGWIDTLEGGHIVCPGDWIITGVKGEHYPCKPDIFTATYEQQEVVSGLPEELDAMADITHERERQINQEGWDAEHDDAHLKGELWRAAYFYTSVATKGQHWPYTFFQSWPWDPSWFKPWKKDSNEIDRERCLIKAGALIIAEQERLERALQKVVGKLAEIQTQKTNE